ncbi:MAG TPA: M67 family metallopeptidase [Candidatus Limnocylindria bacterium]|nr:M67 family metallopeptidase [Candidatus Limnocylindria bacterium]
MTASSTALGLTLPASIAAALAAHAHRELPNEACGLLAGDPATGRVRTFHSARNEHASPLRFSVDARDLVRITYELEAMGQALLAIFHSHPRSAAKPSATDVREARYPDALHVLSGSQGELRAWRIRGGYATEVALSVAAD